MRARQPTTHSKLPDPTEWLEFDEGEATALVEAYHRRAGISVPNEMVHAGIHVAVEKQIALDDRRQLAARWRAKRVGPP